MSRSDRHERADALPPLLAHVIELAIYAEDHDESTNRSGESDFLIGVARLAVQNVGFRGVLAPDPDVYRPIEDLARQHLDWVEAKKELRTTLDRVKKFKRREASRAHTSERSE
jgi:hypothetical protein